MADAPPSPKAILRGHKAQIHAAAFLRDNERLATGDADGHVVIWDLAIMRPAASWRAHENAILGLQGWGRDKFITHGRDHKLIVWKLGVEDEAALSKALPVESVPSPRPNPWMLHLIEVNTLNFCSFAACASHEGAGPLDPRDLGASSDILVAVPNTLLSEAPDARAYCQARRPERHGHVPAATAPRREPHAPRRLRERLRLRAPAGRRVGRVDGHVPLAGAFTASPLPRPAPQPRLLPHPHPPTPSSPSNPIPTSRQPLAEATADESDADEEIVRDTEPAPSLLSKAFNANPTQPHAMQQQKVQPWAHPLKTVNTKHAGQQSLRIRSDGKIFATAGWDSNVRVYSCKTLKELAVLQWHKAGAYAVAFADVGQDYAERLPATEATAQKHTDAPTTATTTSSVVAGTGGGGALLGVKERRIRQARAAHWIAAGAKDGKVSLWDVY
ncbi:uncharacterized protein PCL_06511 [Purpureocillium lilacinum]|uniref:ASTRA-associated protein 1 n=1 Tax=Purpureocillium lilacinum TaxID=33203 RepID=A0A2U3EMX5_PURLI|nr:uncharacterized protein PCL_06511 [Purpureocillium lilacinum]